MVSWPPTRNQAVWWTLGLLLSVLVLYALSSMIGAVVFGVFLYYATRPVYRRLALLSDRDDLAAAGTLLAFGLPLLAVVGYAAVVAARELRDVLAGLDLATQQRMLLQPVLDLAETRPERLVTILITDPDRLLGPQARNLLLEATGPLASSIGFVTGALLQLFVTFTVAYYLLQDGDGLADWFRRSVHHDAEIVGFARNVDDDLETVFFGNLVVIVVNGLIATGAYLALDAIAPGTVGVAYPVLLGALTGAFTLVPAVGIKLAYVPYAAYLFAAAFLGRTTFWFAGLFAVVALVVVDTLPDIFIRAYVASGSLHMGLVLLAYVFGPVAFGWWGVFFGPIVLVFALQFASSVLPRLTRRSPVP